MASIGERKIKDVRDIWGLGKDENKENPNNRICIENADNNRSRHKYKTLERHLSMKKTIRKKMMRDLREIGDGNDGNAPYQNMGFLDQIRTDQPPSANIEKPSLWQRLKKGWGN